MDTSRQPCKYFQQGSCKYGSECLYSHDPLVSKLSDVRPGRVGYRPTYPNMTLDNKFRVNESAPVAPPSGRAAEPTNVGNTSAATTSSLADRRPGRAGYKPSYKKSSSPTRHTRSSTNASSHVNKTTSNTNNHNNNNQPSTGSTGKKKKKGGKKGKGNANPPPAHHQDGFDDRRKSAIQAAAGRRGPQQQQAPASNQVTPEQVIQHDLTNVQPQWMFSCYGISTDWSIAGNIIEGVDYSPEELRLQALSEWKNTGNIQQYMHDVQQLKLYVDGKRQSVLFNPTAALNDALSRRLNAPSMPPTANSVLPLHQQQHQQSIVNLMVNPTASVPQQPSAPGGMAMQDDNVGTFHLGSVPLEPPI